jgi:hypothetical protein
MVVTVDAEAFCAWADAAVTEGLKQLLRTQVAGNPQLKLPSRRSARRRSAKSSKSMDAAK